MAEVRQFSKRQQEGLLHYVFGIGGTTERSECRHGVFLHYEYARRRRLSRPMPARSLHVRLTKANSGRREELILRPRAAIGLAKLEQGAIGEAPVPISLCRCD